MEVVREKLENDRSRLIDELRKAVETYTQLSQRIPFLQGAVAALNDALREPEQTTESTSGELHDRR